MITILREAMDEAILAEGGAEFIRKIARKHPVQFLQIRASLEPRRDTLDVSSRSVVIQFLAEPSARSTEDALPIAGSPRLADGEVDGIAQA